MEPVFYTKEEITTHIKKAAEAVIESNVANILGEFKAFLESPGSPEATKWEYKFFSDDVRKTTIVCKIIEKLQSHFEESIKVYQTGVFMDYVRKAEYLAIGIAWS